MASALKSITNYLTARLNDHPASDLLNRLLEHAHHLEWQVIVDPGSGVKDPDSKSGGWMSPDGTKKWSPYRIPRKADSEPEFRDYELGWAIDEHGLAIGTTGWEWVSRRSIWVGFDFDSIVGHAEGVGLADEQLDQVRTAVQGLQYVEARRSTSGKGYHLYVMVPGVPTANHKEHAALARYVLWCMSQDCGMPLQESVDACGGILWCWHRNMAADAYALVKPATEQLEIPSDWRSKIPAPKGKIRVYGSPNDADPFVALTAAHAPVELDEVHHEIIQALADAGVPADWDAAHHLLRTHTIGFQRLHESGKYRGEFATTSLGNDLQQANCFCFPGFNGAWHVYRFGARTSEHPSWTHDERWTHVWFNRPPTLQQAAAAAKGRELSSGGWEFDTPADAIEAAHPLSPQEIDIEIPDLIKDRRAILEQAPNTKLRIRVARDKRHDPEREMICWSGAEKAGWWSILIPAIPPDVNTAREKCAPLDAGVRYVMGMTGKPIGYHIHQDTGDWAGVGLTIGKHYLQRYGLAKDDAEAMLGYFAEHPWKEVCLPFQPLFPGGRQFNQRAPQLRYEPMSESDYADLSNPHETWDKIFEHLGKNLDVSTNEWCMAHSIKTGADYLLHYYKILIRDPFAKLPFLVFYGPERGGKSTFHEAFKLLLTSGVNSVHRCISNPNSFNGEIATTLLGYLDEYDMTKNPSSRETIKNWIMGEDLPIRDLYRPQETVRIFFHLIMCVNDLSFCPMQGGDSRTVVIKVDRPEQEIGKQAALHPKLIDEASAFLRQLFNLPMFEHPDRMALPQIVNDDHKAMVATNDPVAEFLDECTVEEQDTYVVRKDLYDAFKGWYADANLPSMTRFGTEVRRLRPNIKPDAKRNNKNVYLHLRLRANLPETEGVNHGTH